MKKTILLLTVFTFFIFSLKSYAQKIGHWRNGNIRYSISFNLDGIKHGSFKKWYQNGELEISGDFDNGVRKGVWESFYRSGKLESLSVCRNDSISETWYSKVGVKNNEGYLIKEMKEGKWYEYFDNGNLKKIVEYKNDTISGKIIEYYENGLVKSYGNSDGELITNSDTISLYDDDLGCILETVIINTEYIKNGYWFYFDNQGMLTRKENYYNGKLINFE